MINQYAFGTGYSSSDKPAALARSQSLGYSFRGSQALVPTTTTAGTVSVGLDVSNTGVAPFYYDWPITLASLDSSGTTVKSVTTDWHDSDIAAGSGKQFTGTMDLTGLAPGSYTLVAQDTNPLPGGNGQPIRFANATQDSVQNGWLTLGTTTITSGTATSQAYQAEASGNTLAEGAVTASCAACAGGAKVGYIGNGGTLTFTGVRGGSAITIAYLSAVSNASGWAPDIDQIAVSSDRHGVGRPGGDGHRYG